MGSPLSPIITDIVMQDLEKSVLNTIDMQLPFYYRYVDDIIFATHESSINSILEKFNNYHHRLNFTVEMESNRSLSFLNLLLIIDNNKIKIDWFPQKKAGFYPFFPTIRYAMQFFYQIFSSIKRKLNCVSNYCWTMVTFLN